MWARRFSRTRLWSKEVSRTNCCRNTEILASEITKQYPNYDGYTNNCQNFVRYLLNYACPDCNAPATIQDKVRFLLGELDPGHLGEGRIPGTYPVSSGVLSSGESVSWYTAPEVAQREQGKPLTKSIVC